MAVAEARNAALRGVLGDVGLFAAAVVGRRLRPYQLEPARAIARSVVEGRGLSLSLMFARQAGKNETSAMVEAWLLTRYQRVPGAQLVKCAPTFRPQIINSMMRLRRLLNNRLTRGRWRDAEGYQIVLGEARALFFSAGPGANVVGATATLALEFDEAQDVDQEKHDKDFMPMAATTNATRVYYGTAWTDDTLLARQVRVHRELERRDGVKRHFQVPWDVVAGVVPEYGRYVEAERARLGQTHPMFRTQYLLEEIAGGGRLFSREQLELMRGSHPRERRRGDGVYVAGVDVAGEDEEAADAALRSLKPRKDSTVVTIGRVGYREVGGLEEPRIEVVEHYWWTGRDHRSQFVVLLELINQVWGCTRVCVDATGVGAGVASFLVAALGEVVVESVQFSSVRKSELGFGLLAAVNSGGFKVYRESGGDEDEEVREWWVEAEACRYEMRGSGIMAFAVPPEEGHDDFVMSAALCVAAGAGYGARSVGAVVVADRPYEGERW